MGQTKQEKNKGLALEAFDTLFNRRDYSAAERYWSPDYIQHSAHIAPGDAPRNPIESVHRWKIMSAMIQQASAIAARLVA